jgi:hypothetical protein
LDKEFYLLGYINVHFGDEPYRIHIHVSVTGNSSLDALQTAWNIQVVTSSVQTD